MKAVLAQVAPTLGDLRRNLDLHVREIRRAARRKADLIVFPELSLTGYLLQDLVSDVAIDPEDSPQTRSLAAAGRSLGVVAGFVERGPGPAFHNAAGAWVGGELRHVHRKVYLPTYGMFDESRYLAGGDVFRTFQAPWGATGILICEDFWHLSSSYLLAQQGMDVLIVISAGPVKGVGASRRLPSAEAWLSLGQVVARFLSCFVLYVNRTGYEDGWSYGGASFAVDPSGKVIGTARPLRAESLTVTLDLGRLARTRMALPLLRDEKLDLVRRELDRAAGLRYGMTPE